MLQPRTEVRGCNGGLVTLEVGGGGGGVKVCVRRERGEGVERGRVGGAHHKLWSEVGREVRGEGVRGGGGSVSVRGEW